MSATMPFDEAASRRIEATYSTPDIIEQRRIVRAALGLEPGQDVLDIGSGPGFLACEMAEAVGPGGSVRGIDSSDAMLSVARQRRPAAGSAPVEFGPGQATELPFPDGAFDVVTSTQVYEYVHDMPAALAEAHRVLRPGGRLLVLDTDWDTIAWRSSDADRMRKILAAWDEHLADPYLPRRLTSTAHPRPVSPSPNGRRSRCSTPGTTRDTFSAGLIGFIAAFVPGRAGVTAADVNAWAEDLTGLGADYFFSLNRYLFLAVK